MSLSDYWYIAAPSAALRRKPLRAQVDTDALVLWRDDRGEVFALRDQCAHRGAPLSLGNRVDGCLECPYHGWRWNGAGALCHVPALADGRPLPAARVPALPVAEQDGYLWVVPSGRPPESPPPRFPHYRERGWTSFRMQTRFAGGVAECIENFLDVPHTVFVHRGWFRTHDPRETTARVRGAENGVESVFENEPVSASLVTKLFFPKGRALRHTDRFILPNLSRVDYDFGPDWHFIITSQCTPQGDETLVHTVITFRAGRLGPVVRLRNAAASGEPLPVIPESLVPIRF